MYRFVSETKSSGWGVNLTTDL